MWLDLDPNNQIVTTFWDKTLVIFFLIFFPTMILEGKKIQISLSVAMNPGLMWQFQCCREQKSLPFKTGHGNSTASADTWYIQIQSSLKDEEGQVNTAFFKTNLYWKKRFQFRGTKAKQSGPLALSPSFLLLSFFLIISLSFPCQMAGRQEFDTVKLKWTNRENSPARSNHSDKACLQQIFTCLFLLSWRYLKCIFRESKSKF